jgi:hypothetical protein
MLRSLLSLAVAAGYSGTALAQHDCPAMPLAAESKAAARASLQTLGPLAVQEQPPSGCEPKVTSVLAYGRPLCLLSASIPVMGLAYSFQENEEEPISATYLVEFSDVRHKQLEVLLGQGRKRVEVDALPPKLQQIGIHEELTVTYRSGPFLVSLQKPSEGMPGSWLSQVVFEREDRLATTRRDLNKCK